MSFSERVERAFASRKLPVDLIGRVAPGLYSSDENDALWFAQRNWHDLSKQDWINHADAIFRFTHEAFAYYLQSLLIISVENPDQWLKAADAVVNLLENGRALDNWGYSQRSGFIGFSCEEFAVIKEWLVFFQDRETYNEAYGTERVNRALKSLEILQNRAGCSERAAQSSGES
jgi:hypothetical protein